MKKTRTFSVIGLLLALLLAALPVLAADPVPGDGNTDIVVTNTDADNEATVTALYYEPNGDVALPRTQAVDPNGTFKFEAADASLGDGWEGAMIIQSTYELAAVAEITWTGGGASDGITAGAYLGYPLGAGEMYLPYITRADDAQFTRVTVQNTVDEVATIRMEYTNRNGGDDFVIDDTIDGLGSKTYDMHVPGGTVPDFSQTDYWQDRCDEGFCNWGGALKITALTGEIAAVATNHWRNWAIAYNGASSGGEESFVPSVVRREDAVFGWREFSIIIGQCLEPAGSCDVRIEYFEAGAAPGDPPRLSLTRTIDAGAAFGANTRGGGDWDASLYEVLGGTYAGSAVVSTDNSTDVAVIAYSIRVGNLMAGATSGASVNEAGSETFLPAIYQIGPSCDPPAPVPDWTAFSLIRIQNPTGIDADDVDIYYFNKDGSLAAQELNFDIPAGQSINRNTRNHCGDIDLGLDWEGSIFVSSDTPVVAVAETVWGLTKMNSYNGYSRTP